jgi:hypothetical protein
MKHFRIIALLGLAFLAAPGCGRKPVVHYSSGNAANGSATSDASTGNTTAPSGSECPPLPARTAIGHGIENALRQIYGIDEVPQKVVIVRVAGTDCQHTTVTYRVGGSTPQTSPMAPTDDGHWNVTLYKKQYPL